MECIFCHIVAGDIPNDTVREDEATLAFLDIHPHALGHTVVIPKQHVETIFGLNGDEVGAFYRSVQKTMKRIQEVLKPDGFTVGLNHGEDAGQAIPHLHVHIFPRWKNDGGGSLHSVINNPGSLTVSEIAKRFVSMPL